jgi:hypothetical protein
MEVAVECLPSKLEALSSNTSTTKKKKIISNVFGLLFSVIITIP